MPRMSALLAASLTLAGPLAASARADQCAYISATEATAGAGFIKPGMVLREYCEPCGDHDPAKSKAIVVTDVVVRQAADTDYQEVAVNGQGIDLAYIFVPYQGHYENLALLAQCPVEDVSKRLALPVPATPASKTTPPKSPKAPK